jgi:hypothetical protein
MSVTKRCGVCGRFRAYEEDDRYCLLCGSDELQGSCTCGRAFEFAMTETDAPELHCPRCGTSLRGRASDFEA